ncbi:MAG: HPr kinase/phosphatase C-terminal domain-containing protein [Alphaproteobacteria bacterium]
MKPIYATSVELGGKGVLLRGASASGKSDLALRLLDRGARLIADDQTCLVATPETLLLTAPAAITGKLEVRGIGIVDVDPAQDVPLCLVVDLVAPADVERLPDSALWAVELDGGRFTAPLIRLAPFEASAAAKLALALDRMGSPASAAVLRPRAEATHGV